MPSPVETIAAAFKHIATCLTHAANHQERLVTVHDRHMDRMATVAESFLELKKLEVDGGGMSREDAQLWSGELSRVIRGGKHDELNDLAGRLAQTLREMHGPTEQDIISQVEQVVGYSLDDVKAT